MDPFNASAVADGVWLLAVTAMVLRSIEAWRRFPQAEMIPLQWTTQGEPSLWASRDLALALTPMVGLAAGLLLASAARAAGDYVPAALLAVRFAAPLVLVASHHWHMRGAVETLRG